MLLQSAWALAARIAADNEFPRNAKRRSGRFQDGLGVGLSAIGTISATGFPWRVKTNLSPFSTSVTSLEAFLRNSVKATIIISLVP